jgi:hypothetical protein
MSSVGSFFKWFWRNHRIQVIFIILVLSIPGFLIIYGIVLPVRNYKPSPTSTTVPMGADSANAGNVSLDDNQLAQVRNIIQKENERAFEKNRLSLAEKDSIYMVIDLPDSSIILEIKGVTVKKTRIMDMEVSNRFAIIPHENLLPWISEPFTLKHDLSTIPKSPIVVKQAPKDTIEAAKTSSMPRLPDSTGVFYTFYFDRNLLIEVEQSNPPEADVMDRVKAYRLTKRQESNNSVIQMLKKPEQTDQPMTIRLVLSDVDARAIFRAVPTNTKLILKL